MWGNQAHMDLYDQLIASFHENTRDIRVSMESVPYPDYQQKVSVLAAGRELPDVAWVV